MEQYQNIPSFKQSLQQSRAKWTFIWCLATIFSILAGFSLLDAATSGLNPFLATIPGVLIFGALWGAFVGLIQWLVLRVRAAKAVWWIPCSAAAYPLMLLGMHLVDILESHYWTELMLAWYAEPNSTFYNIFSAIYGDIYLIDVEIIIGLSFIFGIVLGIMQWLALRFLQPLPPEDDLLDDATPPQTTPPPRRITAWWIGIHLLCTFLSAWMAMRAGSDEMPVLLFFILYGVFSSIAFALFIKLLLPSDNKV